MSKGWCGGSGDSHLLSALLKLEDASRVLGLIASDMTGSGTFIDVIVSLAEHEPMKKNAFRHIGVMPRSRAHGKIPLALGTSRRRNAENFMAR